MTRVYLGLDLGGTNFRAGLRIAGETALLDQEAMAADGAWDAEAIAGQVERMLAAMAARAPAPYELAGAGFGLTGDIDCREGVCHSMTRFPALEDMPLGEVLGRRLGVPVPLLNDGLTATLAELHAGAGRGLRDFVMITLGTGIGGGIVAAGRLLAGERGRVGKVGHQIIDLDGPVHCHCGLPGCWQTLAGKEGIIARAREAAAQDPGSALAAAGAVDLARVAALAEAGDLAARRVVEETGRYVGIGLANLVKILAPQRLLIGGGIAERNTLLLETVQETVSRYAIKPYQAVPVVPAAFGKDAGVVGATFLAEAGPVVHN
jgi:glucokinase